MTPPDSIDDRTIELIANRVAAALREELAESRRNSQRETTPRPPYRR